MKKFRLLTLLALLMTVATGAWAQEQSETIATAAGWVEGLIVEGTHFTISNNGNYADEDGMDATAGITVTAKNGETITKVVISCTYNPGSVNDGNTSVSSGTKEITNGGGTITVTGVNASTFTFTCSEVDPQFSQFVVYYTEAPASYSVTMPQDTPDASNWTGKAGSATTFSALPLENVAPGDAVTLKYSGNRKVKTVTATVESAAPAVIDLSMVDCAGTARSDGQWTANCYMVHTAGDYKLPLVYGNAIKAGAANTSAYTGVSGSNTTATFPRHDGQAITAPWIKDNGITVASAELLWQDTQGLVTAVDIDGDYLTLTVGKDATEQEGNALVAAKDASGNIVWSWHIWVTKQTFANLTEIAAEVTSTTPNTSYTYQVTPVNLGWVGDATSTTGYHTYYQWGRKDAFIPSTGTDNANHTVYDINDATVTAFSHTDDNSMTIGGNIQHPTVHYRNKSTYGPCDTQYYNMWDAQKTSNTNAAAATVKTVYDPCPPGFCVPTSGLYNYIASQTRPEFNNGYTYSGVFFPASGYRNSSGGALGGVGSYGYYWSATPNDGTGGRNFYIHSKSWTLDYYDRTVGFPVRAVAE